MTVKYGCLVCNIWAENYKFFLYKKKIPRHSQDGKYWKNCKESKDMMIEVK